MVLMTFLAWTHCVAMPRTVSPTRLTSAEICTISYNCLCNNIECKHCSLQKCKLQRVRTVNGRLPGKHHADELQSLEILLEVLEHRLHLIHADGILAEARLSEDGHARVRRDSLQLSGEVPKGINELVEKHFARNLRRSCP